MVSPLRVCRASTIISGDLLLMREHFESHILNVFDVCAYASAGKSALRRCSGQACGTMSREESTDRSVCATASLTMSVLLVPFADRHDRA